MTLDSRLLVTIPWVTRPDHARISTDVAEAVAVLRDGGLVGMPTETVYGLAADAGNPDAVRRVFAAKGRPADHPLIVHLAGAGDLDRWATEVPETARLLVQEYWPGPLTVLLRRASHVLDEVTGGRDTIALRSPDHPVAHELLTRFRGGLVAPSANRFGRVSPTTAAAVVSELGGQVDLVLDGGPCEVGLESTIVDLTGSVPTVLRRGAVTLEDLAPMLGDRIEAAGGGAEPVAPGMLASHYAPDAAVVVLADDSTDADVVAAVKRLIDDHWSVGVLAPRPIAGLPARVVELDPGGDPDHYAQVLYARLRQADALALEHLVVVPPPPKGIGAAIHDRLARAARRR